MRPPLTIKCSFKRPCSKEYRRKHNINLSRHWDVISRNDPHKMEFTTLGTLPEYEEYDICSDKLTNNEFAVIESILHNQVQFAYSIITH